MSSRQWVQKQRKIFCQCFAYVVPFDPYEEFMYLYNDAGRWSSLSFVCLAIKTVLT